MSKGFSFSIAFKPHPVKNCTLFGMNFEPADILMLSLLSYLIATTKKCIFRRRLPNLHSCLVIATVVTLLANVLALKKSHWGNQIDLYVKADNRHVLS